MLSMLKTRFGVPGVIAAIALVFAMIGGAVAASGPSAGSSKARHHSARGLTKSQVIALIKKSEAAEPPGPQGLKGDTGAKGDQGLPGKDGTFSTKPLPAGQSLSGVWATSGGKGVNSDATEKLLDISQAAISFPIRVSPSPIALYEKELEFGAENFTLGIRLEDEGTSFWELSVPDPEELEKAQEAFEEACPGSASDPQAGAGFLCIYPDQSRAIGDTIDPSEIVGTHPQLVEPANPFGITVPFRVDEESALRGSWAVTGG
jgi:hypothetical protein